jgi:hypothetical protein
MFLVILKGVKTVGKVHEWENKPDGLVSPNGERSARQALLYEATFSQGFAPHPTKGVRPLDTHDGAPCHCYRWITKKIQ